MKLSTRNRLPGTITEVVKGEAAAKVTLQVGDNHVVALITRESADELGSRSASRRAPLSRPLTSCYDRRGCSLILELRCLPEQKPRDQDHRECEREDHHGEGHGGVEVVLADGEDRQGDALGDAGEAAGEDEGPPNSPKARAITAPATIAGNASGTVTLLKLRRSPAAHRVRAPASGSASRDPWHAPARHLLGLSLLQLGVAGGDLADLLLQ
jgi:molybdopterin-binding protein